MDTSGRPDTASLRSRVAEVPRWYHTIDLSDGVTTPGWFDLRPVVGELPWPDVEGRRCLDVGTYDGFLAFEMARRGAREVVATDIASEDDWDWFPRARTTAGSRRRAEMGEKGAGFQVANAALGAGVERRVVNVYDLHPDDVGTFDVVVCGQLLLHLRDPWRALEAIRGVCTGTFLSIEQVDPVGSVLPGRGHALRIVGHNHQWVVPARGAHRRMLELAGFEVLRSADRFVTPFGLGHPPLARGSARQRLERRVTRVAFGGDGIPTSAVLARPAV